MNNWRLRESARTLTRHISRFWLQTMLSGIGGGIPEKHTVSQFSALTANGHLHRKRPRPRRIAESHAASDVASETSRQRES
jgi:hypothetical protein